MTTAREKGERLAAMKMIEGRSIPVPESGCWLWEGPVSVKGYGRVSLGKRGKKNFAHRLSWSAANGAIKNGMCICHKCDTPLCVNPAHLFMGTPSDNNADRKTKGRYAGEWNGRCLLSAADVLQIRDLSSVMRHVEIASYYGVAPRTITDICNNKTWGHL